MPNKRTAYLSIPKAEALRKITGGSLNYVQSDEQSTKNIIVVIHVDKNTRRAELTDYKIPEKRARSGDLQIESETIGTQIDYYNSDVHKYISEYEL